MKAAAACTLSRSLHFWFFVLLKERSTSIWPNLEHSFTFSKIPGSFAAR